VNFENLTNYIFFIF